MPRARLELTEFLTSCDPTNSMTSNSSSVVLFHPSTSIPQRPITLQRYTRKYQARTNNLHPHRCPHLTRESSRLVLFFQIPRTSAASLAARCIPPHRTSPPLPPILGLPRRHVLIFFPRPKRLPHMYEVGVPRLLVGIRASPRNRVGGFVLFSIRNGPACALRCVGSTHQTLAATKKRSSVGRRRGFFRSRCSFFFFFFFRFSVTFSCLCKNLRDRSVCFYDIRP